MSIRYRIGVAVTSLAIVSAAPAPAAAPCRPPVAACAPAPSGLYSARALRRARRILQLQLLELRKAELERVRDAIVHRLPPDALLEGAEHASLKHSSEPRVICD